jgi:hypothetical protein
MRNEISVDLSDFDEIDRELIRRLACLKNMSVEELLSEVIRDGLHELADDVLGAAEIHSIRNAH